MNRDIEVTTRQWERLVKLAQRLEFADLLPRLRVSWLRSQSTGPMIAVVGVVNRGKSTLINEVMRQSISPESSRPETASILGFASDIRKRPSGISYEGERVRLPRLHRRFKARVSRGSGLAVALFGSAKHIRPGVLLVDTPGIDEAEGSDSQQSLALSTAATLELADAAIVVLGIPGVKGTDMKLLKRAVELHGLSRVLVVIKSNDSSIARSDLEMWQEELSLGLGKQLVALISDHDKTDLRIVNYFINAIWNSNRTLSDKRISETLSALCLAIESSSVVSVPRRVLKHLPEGIAKIVTQRSPKEVRKREELERRHREQLEAERTERLRAEFKKLEDAWANRQRALVDAAYSADLQLTVQRDRLNAVTEENGRLTGRVGAFFSQNIRNQQELALSQASEALRYAQEAFSERCRERDKHARTRPLWVDFLKQNS